MSSSIAGRSLRIVVIATVLTLIVTALSASVAGAATKTKRASVKSGGGQSNGEVSFGMATSASGRFVVFQSSATDLVGGDTNGSSDLFIKDFKTGKAGRISVGSGGRQAKGGSSQPSISDDGRFVAFRTAAGNLAQADSNGTFDIYLRDRKQNKTKLISKTATGAAPSGPSWEPDISAGGRFVAYYSLASTLVAGDTNKHTDVFVYDRKKRKTTRVSVGAGGKQANEDSSQPAISGNGRYVVFTSDASNLVSGDTNKEEDVFVRDRWKKKTRRVSVRSDGAQAEGNSFNPDISADGRYVVFESWAGNLVGNDTNGVPDVFIHDLVTRKTKRVSVDSKGRQAMGDSTSARISADGRFVAFESSAADLIGSDTNGSRDVFIRDRKLKKTRRVSLRSNGKQTVFGGRYPALSADARFIAFSAAGGDLVANDTNSKVDAFRRGALR